MKISALSDYKYANNLYANKVKKQQCNFGSNDSNVKSTVISGKETSARIYTGDMLDYKTMDQIKDLCNHPAFKDAPIRIMPDVHPSSNTIVGFSAPVVNGKVIPSIIGGDIGCGMLCVKIDTQGQDIDYAKLDDVVKTYASVKKTRIPQALKKVPKALQKDLHNLCKKLYNISADEQFQNLGTIGGGNHFVEIDSDKNGQKYLIIHSGSRTLGKKVADRHEYIARHTNHYHKKELSYLTGDELKEYMQDMRIAQEYAKANRRVIADEILYRMGWKEKSSFESVHNYIDDKGILRKGAIAAELGRDLLIPLNMRDGVVLAKGKGNPEWNNTAPHGAGRKVARGEAHKTLSYEKFVSSMDGIYTSCVRPDTLDEAPDAYKNADDIIENISETADIIEVVKPVYNYKD